MRKRALLSVADKAGLPEFARGLADRGYEIVSSGGTAKVLEAASVPVRRVAEVTGSPEILGGRVKTLHPTIHGGILARRHLSGDLEELDRQGILPVDIVAVNFYPFEKKVAEGSPIDEILENIDIGGPSMLRASAKNFRDVLSVTDPADYALVLSRLDDGIDLATRLYLAKKAFRASACYEEAIASFLARLSAEADTLSIETETETETEKDETGSSFPSRLVMSFDKVQDLRYGENPHQAAAFYRDADPRTIAVAGARQLHGKELSYNNILDLDAAWRLARELPADRAAAVIIKHTNPAGAAIADSLIEAYVSARATDPVSAFGGIVALNRDVDVKTAEELKTTFLEAIVAPGFDEEALAILTKKKNIRLMTIEDGARAWRGSNLCRVLGGLLVQSWDQEGTDERFEVVTQRAPTESQERALRLAWIAAKHVKSNAIVLAKGDALIGVGAGQMSRVDSSRIAVDKAKSPVEGSVAASDAFFPFRDGVDALAEAGVVAIVQPGGSVRDDEVIAAANEREVAMVFTGRRHFRH
jgi:phosphoribosylaminoimidazolecarboxamide formyltransferase/IMP cyclohydrolase